MSWIEKRHMIVIDCTRIDMGAVKEIEEKTGWAVDKIQGTHIDYPKDNDDAVRFIFKPKQ
jgi:hypothetical protein